MVMVQGRQDCKESLLFRLVQLSSGMYKLISVILVFLSKFHSQGYVIVVSVGKVYKNQKRDFE